VDTTADNQAGIVNNPAPTGEQPNTQTSQSLADFLTNRMAGNQQTETVEQVTEQVIEKTIENIEPPQTTPTEPRNNYIPDKFRAADGSLNSDALLKSYVNMESMFGKQSTQMNDLQQTVIALQQQIVQQAQSNAQPEDQLTPEEIQAKLEEDNDKFWEIYNENPRQAIADLIKEVVSPIIEPVQQSFQQQQQVQEWSKQISAFEKDHADFYDLLPDIKGIIDANKEYFDTHENGLQLAYDIAKSKKPDNVQPQLQPPPTAEDLLKDPNFIAKITSDPAIKNAILQQHMQELKNNGAPPVVGSLGTGLPSTTVPVDLKDPKTAKEALKAKYAGVKLV
jgi:hypothetical protein